MAINETRRTSDKEAPPPANRTISDLDRSDLSVSGFRVGTLAVSLVDNLLSSTRSLFNAFDAPATNIASPEPSSEDRLGKSLNTTVRTTTSTTRPTSLIQPTTTSEVHAVAAPTASTITTQVDSTSPTPTVTPALTTPSTSPATTMKQSRLTTTTNLLPVSDEPFKESIEPENNLMIFGQPYLITWPTLDMWERMAWCESRNTWNVDTGNGYYGGLQFALGSWQWMGGEGSPADATKEEQIYRANLLWQAQGWNGWPGCKTYFGWSRWQTSQ